MNILGKMLENRYEILEKVGIGGMATVYRAKCHILNREVAIKVLKDEYTTDSEFIKRFNAEAQSAAALTHSNIVSVYDVGNEDDMYYIVMELVKGSTLKEIISDEGKLPWKWSLNIASQIASALEIAHRNGIVHRDIKPHNIIITEDGIAKVTDFGIAKAVTNSTMTSYGSTIGSVHYFSPEHAKGALTDAKSDLYSLGIVLYEMVTGRVPFDADTPVSVALKQVQEKPIEPISINPDIPEGLNYIILKSMEKDKTLRYNSAREILEDLDILIKNPEVDFTNVTENVKKQLTTVIPTVKGRTENTQTVFERKPWLKPALIIASILLLILIPMAITVTMLKNARSQEAFIPNLTGELGEKRKTKTEAEEELNKLGFKFEITEEFSDEVEKDQIIRQDPKFQPNFKIKLNTTIKLTVSKGEETLVIPEIIKSESNYKEKTVEEIKKELDKAQIKYEEIEEFSETVEAGKLLKLEFELVENTTDQIKKKNVVKITISKGTSRKEVTIPNVVDKTASEAKRELEKLGLVVTEEKTYIEYKSNGVVTATSTQAGQKLREKDSITIYVNDVPEYKKGKLVINIRKLSGLTDDELVDSSGNPKKLNVRVQLADDQVAAKTVNADETAMTVDISSLGRAKVKVYINETNKYEDFIDLNQKDTWNI